MLVLGSAVAAIAATVCDMRTYGAKAFEVKVASGPPFIMLEHAKMQDK
jgi:hypothetical protein